MELTQLFILSSKMSSCANSGLKNVANTSNAPKVVVNGRERLRWQVKGEMFSKMKELIDALREDERFSQHMQRELDDLHGVWLTKRNVVYPFVKAKLEAVTEKMNVIEEEINIINITAYIMDAEVWKLLSVLMQRK